MRNPIFLNIILQFQQAIQKSLEAQQKLFELWQRLALLIVFFLFSQQAFAQAEQGGEDATGADVAFEVSGLIGNILPNQIDGFTEILGLGGGRVGYRVAPGGFLESTLSMGKGDGVEWMNAALSLRIDRPIQNLVGHFFFGGDVNFYQGVGRSKKMLGGGHLGGGIMSVISDVVWFRADMKFAVNPGTSLFINCGFMFRF